MDFISFTNLKWALLCMLSNTAFAHVPEILAQYFEKDEGCLDFSKFQIRKLLELQSKIQCAVACLDTDLCQFFKSSQVDADVVWCELALANTLPPSIHTTTAAPNSKLQGVRCYKRVTYNSTIDQSANRSRNGKTDSNANSTERLRDCDKGNNWFSYCYEDQSSDLHQSEWLLFIDSNDPATQTESHIKSPDSFREGKMVFYDDIVDTIHALTITVRKRSAASFVYAMEKDEHGFGVNPSRIVHSGTWEGKLFSRFIYPNQTFSSTSKIVSHLHIFINLKEIGEYAIKLKSTSVSNLVENVKNGYKTFYEIMKISDGPIFSAYRFDDEIFLRNQGKPEEPLQYVQRARVAPGKMQTCSKHIGVPDPIANCDRSNLLDIRSIPHWKPLSQDALATHETIALVGRLMIHGHKFRVAFDNWYFDVDDIIQSDKDVYFILPQDQVKGASMYLSKSSVGKRAVISSNGFLSWCSHPFEGENVLDYGSSAGINVSHFVDTKAWSAALSVFSNGTIAFGSVQEVADGAKGGRDVNVLIEWLNDDLKRQFKVCMLTIKGFGTPDVLVSAESGVSWNLARQRDGEMVIDVDCNMEKVLVNSNGEMQVLVYNVHYRRPVENVTDIRITWFLH